MTKSITLKITLALFFVITCQCTLMAQDTTKKVVKQAPSTSASSQQYNATPPPQAITIIPTRTAIYSHAKPGAPISMPSKNAWAHPVPVPVTTANTTAPKTGAPTGANTAGNTNPAVAVKPSGEGLVAGTPASAPAKVPVTGGAAPTMAETPGEASYLHTPPAKTVVAKPSMTTGNNTPTITAAAKTPVNGTNTNTTVANNAPASNTKTPVKNIDSNSTANNTVTSPQVTATVKKDTAASIAKKDSLIAKKDTAKKDSLIAKKDTSNDDTIEFQPRRIAFLEVGGPGLAISANYDARVKLGKAINYGFRAGMGYFQSGNNWVFTIPLQANYLYGKDGKYIEFGLGTTFLISRGDNYSSKNFIFDDDTGFIATGTIGVRYQPVNGKLNFRLGYVPIIDDEGWVNAGGFSIGYNF